MLEEVSKKKVNSTFLISVYCFEITGVEKKNYFGIFVCFFFDLYVIYFQPPQFLELKNMHSFFSSSDIFSHKRRLPALCPFGSSRNRGPPQDSQNRRKKSKGEK